MAFLPYITEGGEIQPFYKFAYRSRSDKPYTEPLPYESFIREERGCITRYDEFTFGNPPIPAGTLLESQIGVMNAYQLSYQRADDSNGSLSFLHKNARNQVHNRALDKVASSLAFVPNLFEAWYERREVYKLLGQCLKSIRNLVLNFRKRAFWENLKKSLKKDLKQPKTLPELWLLLQFAIKPLIGTIDDAIHLLSAPIPFSWVEGASGGDLPPQKWVDTDYMKVDIESELYIVKVGCRVTAVNPNLALANIMGLTTPITNFLNVVPWGWAVNYFVNLNAVVSNIEVSFPGVSIDKSYTTIFSKAKITGRKTPVGAPYEQFWGYNDFSGKWMWRGRAATTDYFIIDGSSVYTHRSVGTGFPSYKLAVTFPALGTNQFANLSSAIALAFSGGKGPN